MWESGTPSLRIAKMPGAPSRSSIDRRRVKEGWTRQIETSISSQADRIVAGLDSALDPLEVAERITEEAQRRATVEKHHREDWGPLRTLLQVVVKMTTKVVNARVRYDDPEEMRADSARRTRAEHLAKIAKILAESMEKMQNAERKAWRLEKSADEMEGNKYANKTDRELDARIEALLREIT